MPAEATPTVEEHYTEQDLQDMLPIYYKRLFPHKNFYRWLSYGEGKSECQSHTFVFVSRIHSFVL